MEQTDLKINDVVGLELYLEGGSEGGRSNRDISHPQLYGTVNIYLVHSHDLFLRDTIDAKGHQGVKGDTGKYTEMCDNRSARRFDLDMSYYLSLIHI